MKKLIGLLVLAALIFSSCQKESPASYAAPTTTATTTEETKIPVPIPEPSPTPAPSPAPVPTEPLSARFTYTVPDPNNIFENQPIQFKSLGTGIVSWVWQFGNGTKLVAQNPAQSYPIHGYYNVTLTVTDKDGNTASSTQQVLILCNFTGGSSHPF